MKKATAKSVRPAKPRRSAAGEIEELRARLEEAEETIEALRSGAVDAVVVNDSSGHQVLSLNGADQPYRVYVERMQEGAVTLSSDGVILFCNLRFASMIGLSLERVIGTLITQYLPADAWESLSQVFGDGNTVVKQSTEIRGVGAAAALPVLLTASELPMEDQQIMCLVVTDLRVENENTRLRTAKEVAESASLAKDQFFAALSHELRTPLTPVLMTLTALEMDPTLAADVRQDVLMMKRNIELETKLVDDLLDLNRIATGKLKLEIQAVDLNEAVRQVCDICRSQEGNEDVVFETELDEGAGSVAADPSRLHQVLWNVLKNAIKFTPEKGAIRVITRRLPGGRCEVRVQDQGIGIPAETLPRIFDAFEQGEANITRQFGGLGLGLAICKAIMELHHGTIRAESPGTGFGATFIMELPGKATTSTAKIRLLDATDKAAVQKLRLLLVEDHPDTLQTLGRLLTGAGYVILSASSVSAARDLAQRESFDMVVSDLGLPDGDGYEVMRHIQELRKEVPGIAMSGYGMDEDVLRSREAGFSEHLTKPVQFAALKRAIARLAPQPAATPTPGA
ncbi:MAG: ATP-binding protein [Prosthecobacter sp.]